MFNRKVKLPFTLDDFDILVDKVCKKYKLSDKRHAASVISVAIRHIPNTQGYTTLDYLGQYILKNIANGIADHKGKEIMHEAQIDQLAFLLQEDPNNFEARDALQKAADEGSIKATEAMHKYEANMAPNA